MSNTITPNDLFPDKGRLLLTGSGKEFIERIGIEATKQAILNVMMGENLRTQTEPLSQQRVAVLSGAIISLFTNGFLKVENFSDELSNMAVQQIKTTKTKDKGSLWIANWLVGLTGKSIQNVLRSNPESVDQYLKDFEQMIEETATKCKEEFGELTMTLGFVEDGSGKRIQIGWKDIARLTTAISSQTLTIRGSEKSMYGKLFEKLILGSYLTILGFERVNQNTNTKTSKVFWLSDSADSRESDATLLNKPNELARFDIGFIGKGNPEISKDKLSRYAREFEVAGKKSTSVTFIIVDRLPEKSKKTEEAAKLIGAEIVQMSMQYWVRELAQKLGERLGIKHELQLMEDEKISEYLRIRLATIPVQDFLSGLSVEELEEEPEVVEDDEVEVT